MKEKGHELQIVERLGFARCRMSIALPKNVEYVGSGQLNGTRIATSYPNILRSFLAENETAWRPRLIIVSPAMSSLPGLLSPSNPSPQGIRARIRDQHRGQGSGQALNTKFAAVHPYVTSLSAAGSLRQDRTSLRECFGG